MSKQKVEGGKSSKPNKVGNPSKYDTHVKPYLEEIKGWYRKGLTVQQIAENLNIATSTLMLHKTKHSELSEALKTSAQMALMHVENSLYKMATGYDHEEVTEVYDASGELKEKKVVKKHQTPNVASAIFILKNRDSKNWRDKQHVFQASSTTVRKDYEHMTDSELEAEMDMLEGVVPETMDDGNEGELH